FIKVGESLSQMLAPLSALGLASLIGPLRKFRGDFTDTLFGRTKVNAFARGGFVPGSGNKDDVPAVLTPGEFVINKDAAKKIGYDNLRMLNSGKAQGFAKGGVVGGNVSNTKDVLSNPLLIG